MAARQLVAVGFRLFAIWLCVAALQTFGIIVSLKRMIESFGNAPWLGLWLVGIFIGVAIIVWALSGPLAHLLTVGLSKAEATRLSPADLVAVGCVLMGLWWIKEATVPLVGLWLKAVALSPESGQTAFAWLGANGKITAGLDLLQVGIGAYFVSQPHKIAARLIGTVTASAGRQVTE